MNSKEYLVSLKTFLVLSFVLFVISMTLGFFGAKLFPDTVLRFLNLIKAVYGELIFPTNHGQFLFIVFNSLILLALILLLSSFLGIFPILVLLTNGIILGGLIFFLKSSLPASLFLMTFLPYGIIEIPILILACGAGLKMAKGTMDVVMGKEELKKEKFSMFGFFLKFLVPLFVLAALIEIYIIPIFINKLFKI